MASIVLGSAGSALGAATGLPFASVLGGTLGRTFGNSIDSTILGVSGNLKPLNGPRLADLGVQTSTYGKMIPIVYGLMRIAGNVIWSQNINESVSTTTSSAGKGGGGGTVSQTSTTYSYSITLAIAICEGPVDQVLRIWADAEQLDLSQYTLRIYNGDESQLPDTLIQSVEGVNNTPAFRGQAYVIFENFPMGDYGNRIPNFTFEVKKTLLATDYNDMSLENMITGMVMIPGAGEFVYDTVTEAKIPGALAGSAWVQNGNQQTINTNTPYGETDSLASLDQLQQTCPNVEWVSVVVAWFGTSMTLSSCTVLPGVEYQDGATTTPNSWGVAGFNRSTAYLIYQLSGSPQYGGTPDDGSIVRYLQALRTRGYKIAFYPLMFMDVAGKPWRGTLTGSATDVNNFFTQTNGYNAFINHYVSLVNGYVDAFIIGSELKGITAVTDTPGNYPGVNALVSLAATVKTALGSSVKITYAADWSEYHHTDGGWYNLDPLWASPNIDVIGIDAYFPLTNAPQDGYDITPVVAAWTSGEGYDFYYSDMARTIQVALTPPYAWKNIAWFWNNTHTNPDSTTTAWTPTSKPIWFTEIGYPSVDGATNEPNVFYDPTTTSSAFPYFSQGRVDFLAQRTGLTAAHAQWLSSGMVTQMFVWTWDARPYPYWPDLTAIWSDGVDWQTGHWVQGKLGTSALSSIIMDLCTQAGLDPATDIDVSQISTLVEGFIINRQQTLRTAIEALQAAYFFDVVESDYVLKFVPRGGDSVLSLTEDQLAVTKIADSGEAFSIVRAQEIELPKQINVVYVSRLLNYQSATQYSQRQVTSSLDIVTIDLPIVCDDQTAKTIADITLFSQWYGRNGFQFDLPVQFAQIEPSDVITVTVNGIAYRMRVVTTSTTTPGIMQVQAVAEDISTFDFYTTPGTSSQLLLQNQSIATTSMSMLDIAAFPGDDPTNGVMRLAANGLSGNWNGSALYRSDDNGADYSLVMDVTTPATIGTTTTALSSGPLNVFDIANTVTVSLIGTATLQSITQLGVLNGSNAALIGNEIIQFTTATLSSPGIYILSGLLRGRLGTDWAIGSHAIGDQFILLNGAVDSLVMSSNLIGLLRQYKAVSFGSTLSTTSEQDFTYTGVALKPYSPVDVTGTRDVSSNLTINWIRRTRLGGAWQDGVDAPLNETTESYQIDIMSGSAVARTITGLTSPTANYTAAQQITDFGSAQSSITMNVYQMSAVVGRGYARNAVV